MSQDTPPPQTAVSVEPPLPKSIYLIAYPKIVFMYPTMLMALFAGIFTQFFLTETNGSGAHALGVVFWWIFTLNLVVLSFDFPRTTSLTLVFFLAAFFLGLYLLFSNVPTLLPFVTSFFSIFKPVANATFYYMILLTFIIMYILVYVYAYFDYWEVRPNELLHHHGFLSDMERISAPNMKIDKEINDLFEYLLLRSGRLILHPSNEPRAIVLDNVFFINKKEGQITRMLGALQVQVRQE
jgi:hypothetical protein